MAPALSDMAHYFHNLVFCSSSHTSTLQDPVGTSTRLRRSSPKLFAKIPIADSPCSRVLRVANAQHIIFNVICSTFWQPFFSKYLWKHDGDRDRDRVRSVLAKIYSDLATHGEDVQQNWKVATLKVLDQ